MNGTAAKATRREIRRAFGPQAVNAISETQQNTQATVQSVAFAHERIDAAQAQIDQHHREISQLADTLTQAVPVTNTFWGRLRWLVMGR